MARGILILLGAAVSVLVTANFAWAQDTPVPTGPPFERGPGFYLSIPKFIALWALFLLWVRTTDWVSQACWMHRFNYVLWNSIVFFSFVAAFLLFFLLPWFWLGFVLLLVAYIGPLTAFIVYHNRQVQLHEKVLTRSHIRYMLAQQAKKVGIKMEAESRDPREKGPPVEFTARGGATERDNSANLLLVRQSPGFLPARETVADAVKRRTEAILLEYTREQVAINFMIDGMSHAIPPRERESGDQMLVVFKTLAALNPAERRAKQEGEFGTQLAGTKYNCRITSQGTESGERVRIQFYEKGVRFKTLDELGMRAKMQEQLLEVLSQQRGLILVSALPANGLTALFDVVLRSSDRYVREFAAVEDVARPEREIENVGVTTYDSSKGESPVTVLPKLIRTYPNVLVVRDLVNPETVNILIEQYQEDRLVISGIRAREAVEALLRVLLMKVPADQFAPVVIASINQRLVRKLCDECKEAYPPSPELLKQMGLPPGKIESFYRPPQEPEKVCQACGGTGYVGRTGLFELLVVDDTLRDALVRSPKLDVLRQVARKAGMRTFQEEGVLLVARGITSIAELQRVLKQ